MRNEHEKPMGRWAGGSAELHGNSVSVREYRELEAGTRMPNWETFDRICKLYGWPHTQEHRD